MGRNDHTEYAGGPGGPQRRPGGLSKGLTNGQRARVLRQMGVRGDFDATAGDLVGTGGVPPVSPVTGKKEPADRYVRDAEETAYNKATRKELSDETNDYYKEVGFDS